MRKMCKRSSLQENICSLWPLTARQLSRTRVISQRLLSNCQCWLGEAGRSGTQPEHLSGTCRRTSWRSSPVLLTIWILYKLCDSRFHQAPCLDSNICPWSSLLWGRKTISLNWNYPVNYQLINVKQPKEKQKEKLTRNHKPQLKTFIWMESTLCVLLSRGMKTATLHS